MVDHRFANLKTLKTKAEVKMADVYHRFIYMKTAMKKKHWRQYVLLFIVFAMEDKCGR